MLNFVILHFSSVRWRCWDSFEFLASLPEAFTFPPTRLILTQLHLWAPLVCSIPMESLKASSHLLIAPFKWISIYFYVFLFFLFFFPIVTTNSDINWDIPSSTKKPLVTLPPQCCGMCPAAHPTLCFPQFCLLFMDVTVGVPLMKQWNCKAISASVWHMTSTMWEFVE